MRSVENTRELEIDDDQPIQSSRSPSRSPSAVEMRVGNAFFTRQTPMLIAIICSSSVLCLENDSEVSFGAAVADIIFFIIAVTQHVFGAELFAAVFTLAESCTAIGTSFLDERAERVEKRFICYALPFKGPDNDWINGRRVRTVPLETEFADDYLLVVDDDDDFFGVAVDENYPTKLVVSPTDRLVEQMPKWLVDSKVVVRISHLYLIVIDSRGVHLFRF